LEDRDTDFRRSDVNVVVDNLNFMTISDIKKQAKQRHIQKTESKASKSQDSKKDDSSEDMSGLDQLMSFDLFHESNN
ncbi:hypothetical protein WN48_10210, partial [Eufriesea mexicana]